MTIQDPFQNPPSDFDLDEPIEITLVPQSGPTFDYPMFIFHQGDLSHAARLLYVTIYGEMGLKQADFVELTPTFIKMYDDLDIPANAEELRRADLLTIFESSESGTVRTFYKPKLPKGVTQ